MALGFMVSCAPSEKEHLNATRNVLLLVADDLNCMLDVMEIPWHRPQISTRLPLKESASTKPIVNTRFVVRLAQVF